MKGTYLLISSVILAAVISFIGIGDNDYWDDEANTAIIGRNFINSGSLSVWDGRNLMSYGMSGSCSKDLKKKAPPLQYVLAGISLKIFGDTTAGGRVLFLIIGLFAIPLTAMWYKEEFGGGHYWITGFILALTVTYLLYIRQVRYYGPGLTFSFGILWAWASVKTSGRLWPWLPVLFIFLILLVLTQYLFVVAVFAVICLSLLQKQFQNRNNLLVAGVFLVMGIVSLEWISVYSPNVFETALYLGGNAGERLSGTLQLFRIIPLETLRYEFVAAGALLFCIPGWLMLRNEAVPYIKNLGVLVLYGFGVIIAVSLFHPQHQLSIGDTGMRYYIVLIPIGAAMAGTIFEMLFAGKHRWTGPFFLVVLLSSNLLTFNFLGKTGLHCRLYEYLRENITDYTTGSEAISSYIENNIEKSQCIFMVPLYTNIIQMYYHPEYKFCGLVSNKAKFAEKNRDVLREDLFFENVIPDIFIVRKKPAEEFQYVLNRLYGDNTYTLLVKLPVYGGNLTRPEIPWRKFGPIKTGYGRNQGVLIFERTDVPVHLPLISGYKIEKYIKF